MTRKTWPLLLGSVVIPALLIGACNGGGDDDDDSDDSSVGSTSSTKTTGTTVVNQGRGGGNGTTAKLGSGGSNRFTQQGNFGGVLGRGGASMGGRGGTTGNIFNQGGSAPVTAPKAGSAGMPQNMAGNAGKSATNAGAPNAGGATGVGGSAPASGGTTAATGGVTGVAGATNTGSQCPNGCAAISVPVADDTSVFYVLDIPQQTITSSTQITVTAKVFAPAGGADLRFRLILDDSVAATDPCTPSGYDSFESTKAGFTSVSKQFTCSGITSATRAGFRIQNVSGAQAAVKLYVESITVKIGAITVDWTPSATSIDDSPGNAILGPAAEYTGATIGYQAP